VQAEELRPGPDFGDTAVPLLDEDAAQPARFAAGQRNGPDRHLPWATVDALPRVDTEPEVRIWCPATSE